MPINKITPTTVWGLHFMNCNNNKQNTHTWKKKMKKRSIHAGCVCRFECCTLNFCLYLFLHSLSKRLEYIHTGCVYMCVLEWGGVAMWVCVGVGAESGKPKLGHIPYTKQVAVGVLWKAIFWTTPGFLDSFFFFFFFIIKWVLVCRKANVINTTVSLKPFIYNLPYEGTNSNTVGIHVPTVEFGQDLKITK